MEWGLHESDCQPGLGPGGQSFHRQGPSTGSAPLLSPPPPTVQCCLPPALPILPIEAPSSIRFNPSISLSMHLSILAFRFHSPSQRRWEGAGEKERGDKGQWWP